MPIMDFLDGVAMNITMKLIKLLDSWCLLDLPALAYVMYKKIT